MYRDYLDGLLLDRRGFPREVLCEIQMLSDQYRGLHAPVTPDVWDDVPGRAKSALALRGRHYCSTFRRVTRLRRNDHGC